jgi:hypothetical protein
MGVYTSNNISDLSNPTDQRIIDNVDIHGVIVGAVVSMVQAKVPIASAFNPPLILASPRIFVGVDTAGFAAAAVVRFRIFFRYIRLTDNQYLEIAETFIQLNA